MRSNPLASVIVVTFNARAYVAACLSALSRQTFRDFEIIVVDNASTDGTAEFVRSSFPNVCLVTSPTNLGYGAGNNLGSTHAKGQILVLLNPDATAEPDWLANLLSAMGKRGRHFATSKIVLHSDSNRLNSGGNLIHYLGLAFCRGLNAHRSVFDTPELVSCASGAACAISRELFERIGGFDPTFFLYHDDVDLSLRALLAGEPCLYVPDAVVSHDYELSVPPMKWGWIEAHRYATLLKTLSLRTVVVLLPGLLAVDLMTFGYLALRGPAYVAAKLRSYGWLARNAAQIFANRKRAQAVRRFSDREILARLADRIPYEQLAPGWGATLAGALVDPWFRVYRRFALLLVK